MHGRKKAILTHLGGWRLFCTVASARNYVTIYQQSMGKQWMSCGGFSRGSPSGSPLHIYSVRASTVDLRMYSVCTPYILPPLQLTRDSSTVLVCAVRSTPYSTFRIPALVRKHHSQIIDFSTEARGNCN